MQELTIIYSIASLGVGCLIGLIVEMMLDAHTIRELQDDNRRLRMLNAQLGKEKKNVKVIEINDNRAEPESYFTPF